MRTIQDKILARFGDIFYGGGGGSNPATQFSPGAGFAAEGAATQLMDFSQNWLLPESRLSMQQLNPFIAQELNTAFDPQQQLYQRTLQGVTDQTRSGEAARGIANTPYGASVEGASLNNFNIDWQNAQLQRQQSGISNAVGAYSGLIGAGATATQPVQAAGQIDVGLEAIAAQAQTAQNQIAAQEQMAGLQQAGSLGGSLLGKAGGMMGGA